MAITREELQRAGYLDPEDSDPAPRVEFADHFRWLYDTAEPGQHWAIVAPTGQGKTHLIRWILLLFIRYQVLFLQFKRRDPTLAGMGRVVTDFPGWYQQQASARRPYNSDKWATDPPWWRLRLTEYQWDDRPAMQNQSYRAARRTAGRAIYQVYKQGHWVLVADDIKALVDAKQPHLDLGAPIENNLQHGRTAPLTVIGALQEPVYAPASFFSGATHIYLGKMKDVGRHERLAEIGGDTKALKAILPTLQKQEFLYLHRDSDRMEVVKAPARVPSVAERRAMLG